MSSVTIPRSDARPLWLRLLVWSGLVLLIALTPVFLLFGLVELDEPQGRFLLCFGLLLLIGSVAGIAREVVERRLVTDPVQPRHETLHDGERALFLPRAVSPTLISSWQLLGFGVVLVLATVFATLERSWGLAVVLAVGAGWLLLTAVPHRAAELAGGLWLTPTRVIDAYRGIRWELPWEHATGVDAHHPQRVLLVVRHDRVPQLHRTGPRGRAWKPLRAGNVLVIDANHLPGGSGYAGGLLNQRLHEPSARSLPGTL
ncbi:hypothetical protein [Nocardioides coralli]|uniref:hypothetical protein n=1 Tax=Nocardioides coralli TaxID=2872154 RepID=UPI001CA44848|nr:hypothetical protein [Nocardioides coralli]QZY28788.1 hypothetical protein K6T13_15230 [Nocardioides coralli]